GIESADFSQITKDVISGTTTQKDTAGSESIDLILIDTTLVDYQDLADAAGEGTHILLYDGNIESADGVLERAVDYATNNQETIDSISIMSHGLSGEFKLGNEWIGSEDLVDHADALHSLDRVMNDEGNIYLYGCNIAQNTEAGQALLDGLAEATQTDVFASDDATGVGGDWELEAASTGDEAELERDTGTHLDKALLAEYADDLAGYNETAWSGNQTFTDGAISFTLEVSGGGTIDWAYDGATDTLTISDNDGTSSATSVIITDNNGGLIVNSITIDSNLGSLTSNVDLDTINISNFNTNVDTINVGGGSGTITSLNYLGDMLLDTTINANVTTISVAQHVTRDLIVTGNLGALEVTGDILVTSTIDVAGNATTIATGGNFGGHIDIEGDLGTLEVGDIFPMSTIDVAGNATTIEIAGYLQGGIDIEGDLGILSVGTSVSALGSVDVSGTINTFTIGGAANAAGLSTSGSIGTLTINDSLYGDMYIAGDLDAFTVTNNFTGILTVNRVQGEFNLTDGAYTFDDTYTLATEVIYAGPTNTVNVNEAPVADDEIVSIDENVENGILVHTVVASDSDTVNLTYAITGGNADGVFAIDTNTGEITIADNTNLDRETTAGYGLTVEVSDGTSTDTAAITVNVGDVNEFVPVAEDSTVVISETAANGAAVHSVVATDADATATLTYAITGGNADGVFAIDTNT
ncbi:MAG: DUF4347 domain-containing protein, partial [Gammaproteobacteria bacterium]|nr:DUF4347 domain-containing protein [Gammaproteobacteria bacterium]